MRRDGQRAASRGDLQRSDARRSEAAASHVLRALRRTIDRGPLRTNDETRVEHRARAPVREKTGESMQLNERIVGNVAIVEVIGNFVAHSGNALLKDKVRSLSQQGYTRLVVDLGRVPYMDSSGLGELVQAYATIKKAGGVLKLMRVTTRLRDLLTITKLLTVFDTYDDEASVLASFPDAA
jgi:anti-sigma B factor antagonist